MNQEYILTFTSTNQAILGESVLTQAGLAVRVMPLPGTIRAGCGLCLRLSEPDIVPGLARLRQSGVVIDGVYLAHKGPSGTHYEPQMNL